MLCVDSVALAREYELLVLLVTWARASRSRFGCFEAAPQRNTFFVDIPSRIPDRDTAHNSVFDDAVYPRGKAIFFADKTCSTFAPSGTIGLRAEDVRRALMLPGRTGLVTRGKCALIEEVSDKTGVLGKRTIYAPLVAYIRRAAMCSA